MKAWRRRGFLCLVLCIIAAVLFARLLLKLLPCPALTAFCERENSTRFYDRNGVLLQVRPLADGLRREYYPLEALPQELVQDFIAAEDKNFFRHFGVDIPSIIRAALQNRKEGRVVSGASTITMQLARLIYPRKGRVTLGTKCREVLRALRLEAKLSKRQILELYLNNIPFGFQIEGVGSASRSFFSRPPDRLSVEEMQLLSRIPRRPSQYAPEKSFSYPSLCPHAVQYVVADYAARGERLPAELHLSIDSGLNDVTEKQIQRKLEEFKKARIHNGAACALNNRTGEIIVWVGNASFDDAEHSGQIDGVVVQNQPGSSMKPFLYALALERGFAPASVLPDIQQDFGGEGVYVPLNFNKRYNGPVRMRMALASSLNIPAVYLLYRVGMEDYLSLLDSLGFASLKPQRENLGLSLALGSGEVTLLEMVRAFSVFPNDGMLLEPSLLVRRQDAKDSRQRVYQADTARILCDMLSDKAARAMGFGHAAVFDTAYPCIFKTGTSNQFQNIIAFGATSEFTVGVWMGNFGGDTVVGETGSSIPAQIVRGLLDELTETAGASPFAKPEHFEKQEICALSGMAPAADCPAVSYEYVKKSSAKADTETAVSLAPCSWHYTDGSGVKIRYPSEYQHWAHSRNFSGTISVGGTPLCITFPQNRATFIYDPTLPRRVQVVGVKAVGGEEKSAVLYLDGEMVGEARGVFSWNIPLSKGMHQLTVVCGSEDASASFSVK